jgi:RhtB (resistance to homoserine/threonine) family protein
VTVAVIGLLAVMSPGPDFLIVTHNSLLHSRKVGLFTAFGIVLGTMIWIAASIGGISVLILKTVLVFNAVKLLGALYLVYIGIQSLRSKGISAKGAVAKGRQAVGHWAGFRKGILTNLPNPKVAVFFVSFFSVIIDPQTPVLTRVMYGLEISLIALVWFSLVSTMLSTERIKKTFQRWSAWVDRITGAVLILLGIRLAFYEGK